MSSDEMVPCIGGPWAGQQRPKGDDTAGTLGGFESTSGYYALDRGENGEWLWKWVE